MQAPYLIRVEKQRSGRTVPTEGHIVGFVPSGGGGAWAIVVWEDGKITEEILGGLQKATIILAGAATEADE